MQLGFLSLFLLFPAASIAATISYSYQDLGVLGFSPLAINNRGWIVGYRFDSTTLKEHPMRYRPGVGVEQLSNLEGKASDINDQGTVVGYLERATGGVCCVAKAIVRPAGQPWTDIGTLGGKQSMAEAINEYGQAVGSANDTTEFGLHGFLYSGSGGMVDLTPDQPWFIAYEINESGQILGGDSYRTFLYTPGNGWTDLTDLSGENFDGFVLSDNGTVAGWIDGRAAIYSPTLGLRKLGTLGGGFSEPLAINDRGWVVGQSKPRGINDFRAFLYVYGRGLMDLNGLVPGIDTTLIRAHDINDRDQILAVGVNGHAYLLSRIREESSARSIDNPEPSSWFLIVSGLGIAALRNKFAR